MSFHNLDRTRLESACIVLTQVLHQLLKEKKINAQEFLSIVGNLPMTLAELNRE